MSTPTPPKKPRTASSTRHSTGSVLVALAMAPETPATYRPRVGRISRSRTKVGPLSGAPNHGGGCAPGGGGAPGGGVAPGGGGSATGGASGAGGSYAGGRSAAAGDGAGAGGGTAEGAGASCDDPAVSRDWAASSVMASILAVRSPEPPPA